MSRSAFRWLLLLFWMVAIFIASHQPADALPQFGLWELLVKKGGHVIGYAMLAILANGAFANSAYPRRWSLILCLLYAISDEYHQTFITGRQGTAVDVLIDSAGALLGSALAVKLAAWSFFQP